VPERTVDAVPRQAICGTEEIEASDISAVDGSPVRRGQVRAGAAEGRIVAYSGVIFNFTFIILAVIDF
jgi:hypothetical protein